MANNFASRSRSAIVLLSAGLDSTYNLIRAQSEFNIAMVLTFDYGQKAAPRETVRAGLLASHLGVKHEVVRVPWFSQFTKTALVAAAEVPRGEAVQIERLARSLETARAVWVPNRNGIFLNIAAGFAEGFGADVIVPGFNREEATTFPDNSEAFLHAMDASLQYSTDGRVRTHCYSTEMDKTAIVAEGVQVGLPFAMLWPCYLAGAEWCGECESCRRYRRALEANGLSWNDLRKASAL